jgi:alpha-galactosidase
MGKRHLKLAIDVALSGAFGIDLALDKATPEERELLAAGVKLYKESLRELVMKGELYRLVSPYENPLAALSYVSQNKKKAVVYLYQVEDGNVPQIKLNGLDTDKKYTLKEVNVSKGQKERFPSVTQTGLEWMEKGIANCLNKKFESAVLELNVVEY